MSKVLIALGIIIALVGIATGGMIYATPGQMQVMAITPEVAAVLLVGGLTIIGLGVVAVAIEGSIHSIRELRLFADHADDHAVHAESLMEPPSRGGEAAAVSVAVAGASTGVESFRAVEPAHPPSAVDALIAESRAAAEKAIAASKIQAAETVIALDKAKTDLNKVLSVAEPAPPPPPPPQPEPALLETAEVDTVEETEDTQLYVVEERLIRGRPARVLSDGTVEAETDDGWMRFENLEHLEEYLDAMSPGAA